jgi:hypothetical protein
MAKPTIKLATFINKFRTQITAKIKEIHEDLESLVSMNDDERRVMIINEPELLQWAREQGVEIARQHCETA